MAAVSARPKGQPEPVRVHDFLIPELGKAVPYGVYDIAANAGWVNVGIDHDTAELRGREHPPLVARDWARALSAAPRGLLITADCGGSNGARVRLWKRELQVLADELGIAITVCHLPPGTSKWNRIEHRLFAFITQNWRGKPLVSHQVIVQLIAATTTETGLTVHCRARRQHLSRRASRSPTPRWPPSTSSARLPRRLELNLVTDIEQLRIEPDLPARVVIDEASGIIVMGENVRVSTVAIAQGNLTIRITEQPQVSQPQPFADGATVVVPRTDISVDEQHDRRLGIVDGGRDPAATGGRLERAGGRAARPDRHPAGDQGGGRAARRTRRDVEERHSK